MKLHDFLTEDTNPNPIVSQPLDDWHNALSIASTAANSDYEVDAINSSTLHAVQLPGDAIIGIFDRIKKQGTVASNIKKFKNTKTTLDNYDNLIAHAESWMEMWNDKAAAVSILNDPNHKKWALAPQVSTIYRAIIVGDKELNKVKAAGPVIAYATNIEGCMAFLRSLDLGDEPWVIVQKQFNPSDFLLDFTAMYEDLGLGNSGRYESEYEVWMKPIPAYKKFNKKEIVYTSEEI